MARNSRIPFVSALVRTGFAGAKKVRRLLRPVRRAAGLADHLIRYRVPDEQRSCPACGSTSIRHLAPLSPGKARTHVGFVSGCARCGVLFANPLPPPQAIAAVYSPDGDWGRHRQEEQEKAVTRGRLESLFAPIAPALDVLSPPPGAAVLDFGCGLGGMLDAFAAAGWETYGIDPATSVAFARHRELTSVPAEPRFDLAILHHVLEHVTEPLAILRTLSAAIRPGGHLLISVPNLDDLAEHGEIKYCIRADVHVLAYSSDCLAWLLASAGFRMVDSRRGARRVRQRVVLARREGGDAPAAPLQAGRRALNAYFARHPEAVAPLPYLPTRVRAAYVDLERAKWRLQKTR
jgi:SAM-dependent methyltransferase